MPRWRQGDGTRISAARAGAARFGWWPLDGQPRIELDVYPLLTLREMATRARWLAKRSGRNTTTRQGALLLDDGRAMWAAIAAQVGRTDGFAAALSELIAHRLLEGPAETKPTGDRNELARSCAPVMRELGWHVDGSPVDLEHVDRLIHEPLREWRLFGFLVEEHPRWVEGRAVGRYVTALSEVGRSAALAHLHAGAIAPRHDLRG